MNPTAALKAVRKMAAITELTAALDLSCDEFRVFLLNRPNYVRSEIL
jgi:hypothetical protein